MKIVGLFFIIFLFFSHFANAQTNETFDLPLISINSYDSIIDEEKVSGELFINGVSLCNVGIEYRGSTSQNYPKKPYDIELRTESGEDLNRSLLGLPSESDWVLYSPYSDKSLIRNVLIYELSRQSGFYAPRTRFCELVINDEYLGVYVLIEKIKRDKNRVNISKLDSLSNQDSLITGGYIFKIDRVSNDAHWFSDNLNNNYQVVYPKFRNITEPQFNYIKSHVIDFENVLFSSGPDFSNYRSFIDVNSFVDFFVFSELSKNIDSYKLSTFFYKDRTTVDSLIYAGPLWDFNFAFGNCDYYGGNTTDSIMAMRHPMWRKFLEDSLFVNKSIMRWNDLRETSLSKIRIEFVIDSLVDALGTGVQNNFARWDILGTYIVPNAFVGDTYEEEIDYLKRFVNERIDWLDHGFPLDNHQPAIRKESFDCYPNPFNNKLHFTFSLSKSENVNIFLINCMGNRVVNILNNYMFYSGRNEYSLESSELYNLEKGIYFLLIEAENEILAKKILIKK